MSYLSPSVFLPIPPSLHLPLSPPPFLLSLLVLSLPLSSSVSLFLSLPYLYSTFQSHSLSLSYFLPTSLSLILSPPLSLSLSFYLSFFLCLSVFISLSLPLSIILSLTLSLILSPSPLSLFFNNQYLYHVFRYAQYTKTLKSTDKVYLLFNILKLFEKSVYYFNICSFIKNTKGSSFKIAKQKSNSLGNL